jgi:hypothetical protein
MAGLRFFYGSVGPAFLAPQTAAVSLRAAITFGSKSRCLFLAMQPSSFRTRATLARLRRAG